MTHTYAILEVSPRTYREIRDKLEAAGYADQFHSKQVSGEDAEVIDLHGLALKATRPAVGEPPILHPGSEWWDTAGRLHTVEEYRIRDDGLVTITTFHWEAGGSKVSTKHSPGEFCPTPEFPQGFHGYRFVPAGPT